MVRLAVKRLVCFFLIISFGPGCASRGIRSQDELRQNVQNRNFDSALNILKTHDFYQSENERLLRHLEAGLIYHFKENYFQSTQELQIAKDIIEELFTVSLSTRSQIYLIGDHRDIFYGHAYEHSMVYFYKALGHYMLSMQGFYEAYSFKTDDGEKINVPKRELSTSEKREELFRARAELVAWNAFQNTLEDGALGKVTFRRDLLSNFLGGIIHESIGSREDREIALNLYSQALRIALENYQSYRVFNLNYEEFIEKYSDLLDLNLSVDQILGQYLNPTHHTQDLVDTIFYRKLSLVFKHRGERHYNRQLSEYQSHPLYSSRVEKWLEEDLELLRSGDEGVMVSFIFQDGIIPQKKGREIFIGLSRALRDPEIGDSVSVGASVLAIFAAEILGLIPPPSADPRNINAAYFGIMSAELAVREAAIGFEVPQIEYEENRPLISLKIFGEEDPDEVLIERPIALVQPIADLAAQALAEDSRARATRQGMRVAGKHITAIAASFATYNALRGDDDSSKSMARSIALLQYTAASRLIVASERADTRYWSTLPRDIRSITLPLRPGTYRAELIIWEPYDLENVDIQVNKRQVDLGVIEIQKDQAFSSFNFKI